MVAAYWGQTFANDASAPRAAALPATGSHNPHRAPRRDDARTGAVPILMPNGSIALWSHGVWHWQGDRALPGARVAIHVTYNRVFVRQLDDFRSVDDAFYARNPPAFSTLMGQDAPFGKERLSGP